MVCESIYGVPQKILNLTSLNCLFKRKYKNIFKFYSTCYILVLPFERHEDYNFRLKTSEKNCGLQMNIESMNDLSQDEPWINPTWPMGKKLGLKLTDFCLKITNRFD